MFRDDYVAIFDIDGTFTDGKMYYTDQGKYMKAFGCDDWDILKELEKYIEIRFITADTKGLPIVEKRFSDIHMRVDAVSHYPKDRWNWIKERYPNKKIIYMGDGCFDFYCLGKADVAITVPDSLDHVQSCAMHQGIGRYYITKRSGGNRAVAEACIWIMQEILKINWMENI